jgi:hypothetical protein
MVHKYNYHNSVHYPSSCILLKAKLNSTQLNSTQLNSTQLNPTQPNSTQLGRFVRTLQETHYVFATSPLG